ncbi:MAG: lysophospholipid acyltransferase family protein [Candidatus Dormibacteria bacterium]
MAGRPGAARAAQSEMEQEVLRGELNLLYRDVALEVRRRTASRPVSFGSIPIVRRAQEELPAATLQGIGRLALWLREITGRDIIDLGAMMALGARVYQQYEMYRRRAQGRYEVDDFGFDPEWTESLIPMFEWIFENWWRVDVQGLEHVPGDGRALLVSNHAGVLPWDGAMIKVAIWKLHPQPRHARALVAAFFFGLPMLSWFLRRTGQTVGHPDDTQRLLERDELVLVFPEGVKGTGKPFRERYRLRRFGRGGFVKSAIRAQAPIIPISVVGSEEIYPMLADLGPIARLLGFPYWPVTPTFPLLGPLGFVPLPTKWSIRFHEPVPTDRFEVQHANDAGLVLEIADQVRNTIQEGLYDGLMERKTIFW